MESGTRLGRYEILESLGAGGMGDVYRERDTTLRREVAIKMLPEESSNDPELLGRLKRDAHALAALSHPNVAAIHGFEEAEERAFLGGRRSSQSTLDGAFRSNQVTSRVQRSM